MWSCHPLSTTNTYTMNILETSMIYAGRDALENIFLSSDWHFNHKNILAYDNRPFKSLKEMEDYIVNEVNNLPLTAKLFFLWDLHLWNNDDCARILSRIHCPMYRILGNHDSKSSVNKLAHFFITVSRDCWINESLYLNHYPPQIIEKWKYYIHGHTHHPKRKNNITDISYNGHSPLIYQLTALYDITN